jgi:hypothetical protein
MGWDSKKFYPEGADATITVKATPGQRSLWATAARRYGKGTAGAFLNWAGDHMLAYLRAREDIAMQEEEETKRLKEGKTNLWR